MSASSLSERVGRLLRARKAMVATAESCTGGLIAKIVTDTPGSSDWFERGLVTYSNASKQDLLGVPPEILAKHGAVSRAAAEAMARGLLVMTPADWVVAVTGIAGPGGGTKDKPVGLVWLAWARRKGKVEAEARNFTGSRDQVRQAAAAAALQGLIKRLDA